MIVNVTDGTTDESSPLLGNVGGSPQNWNVPDNEYITEIGFHVTSMLICVQFKTDTGTTVLYGTCTPDQFATLEENERLIGIFGDDSTYL